MQPSTPQTLLLLLLTSLVTFAAGCSKEPDSPDDALGAGVGGTGGAGGIGDTAGAGLGGGGAGAGSGGGGAGAGGTGGAGSGGASGGAGGMGAQQAGAGAGSGGAGAVQTTEDCSTHAETNHCYSVRGKLDATAFDFTCLVDSGGERVDVTLHRAWALSCSDAATGIEIAVTIPKQPAGPFSYGIADEDGFTVALEVWKNSTLATAVSQLDLLAINCDVSTDDGTVITGTFQGTFSAGTDPSCMPDICANATVAGSFRSAFDF